MAWVSPTGATGTGWSNPENTYDENTGTYSSHAETPTEDWSNFLELTISSIDCDKIQIWPAGFQITEIDIDLFYDGGWQHLHEGIYDSGEWNEFAIGSTKAVTAARVRGYNADAGTTRNFLFYEFDFNEVVGDGGIVVLRRRREAC